MTRRKLTVLTATVAAVAAVSVIVAVRALRTDTGTGPNSPVYPGADRIARGGEIDPYGPADAMCVAPHTTYGTDASFEAVVDFYIEQGFKEDRPLTRGATSWDGGRGYGDLREYRRVAVFPSDSPELQEGAPGTDFSLWNTIFNVKGCERRLRGGGGTGILPSPAPTED